MAPPVFSLVVPVYRNAASLPKLLDEIGEIAAALDGGLEAVFVVDGSPDESWVILADALPRQPYAAQLIAHSRNFGSFAAIRTGLGAAQGRFIAFMAADLQDPPELVLAFFRALAADECDIAIGMRIGRGDPLVSRFLSWTFWALYRRLVVRETPPGGVDLFGCRTEVRDALCAMGEAHSSLVALLFWVGFRRRLIPYVRRPRPFGRSAWSMRRRISYMLDSVFAFTDLPITLLTITGLLGVVVSAVVSTCVLVAWLLGWISVPGYTPIVLSISFFGALNVLAAGIVGAYVWRTYENSKQRPLSIVARHLRYGAEG